MRDVSFSERARHAVDQSRFGSATAPGNTNVVGAVEMLGGLDYHYANFVRARQRHRIGPLHEDVAHILRHEAVAYINRTGQFLTFARSNFVRSNVGSEAERLLPTFNKLSVFRNKYTAHRSIDQPKGGEVSGDIHTKYHAVSMSSLGGLLMQLRPGVSDPISRQTSLSHSEIVAELEALNRNSEVVFQIFDAKKDEWVRFSLEAEHLTIVGEGFTLIERLCRAVP